jgi:hypothetical protein
MRFTKIFWPIVTGTSFIDVWTLVHFAFWFVMGADWESIRERRMLPALWVVSLAGVLAGAYIWEIVEQFYIEPAGMAKYPEGWINRWVSDPVVGVLGFVLGVLAIRKWA